MKVRVLLCTLMIANCLGAKSFLPGISRVNEKIKQVENSVQKVNLADYLNQKNQAKDGVDKDVAKIKEIECAVQQLFWCKHDDFIEVLEKLKTQKNDFIVALRVIIDDRYANVDDKELVFISDILKEKAELVVLITDSMRLMQSNNRVMVKDIFNQLMKYQNTVNRLVGLIKEALF